jgi:molybdopterin adenylyltransferase
MDLTAWVVTVSDRAAARAREDMSGPALAQRLRELGFTVAGQDVVSDGVEPVAGLLADLCDRGAAHLVVTTGGTGLAPRDLTPEATLRVAHRQVPGLMELARQRCAQQTPLAALGRGVAVTRNATLVINLPGSPQAALQTLAAIADVLPHALQILVRPPTDCDLTGRDASGKGS